MKKHILSSTVAVFLFLSGFAQTKVVLDDQVNSMNEVTDSILAGKLMERDIEYVFVVDFRNKCDYNFSTLKQIDNKTVLEIKDCDNKVVGAKDLGSGFSELLDQEKVIILAYSIKDIISNPGEHILIAKQEQEPEPTKVDEQSSVEERPPVTINHHASRYVFTPTAYNLKKGELYYNTIYFLIHDAQYGITDKFSLGMGTTVGGFPFYMTPKVTLYQGKKNTIALGDMMMLGTWGVSFFGNIAYGVYSYGDQFNNMSIGAGHFHLSGDDWRSDRLLVNFSFMLRISDYFYLTSENYFTGFTDKVYNYYDTNPVWIDDPYSDDPAHGWYEYDYIEETYDRNNIIFAGISGIRWINKTNDVVSYQVGLAYFSVSRGNVPSRFKEDYYDDRIGFAIPLISYTRKFGYKF